MISVTILLKAFPKRLQEVLGALQRFDEVLVYNNGASREALEVCRRFSNVRMVDGPFLGFGKTHNAASNLAKNDWILSVDSDEVVSQALVDEIFGLELKERTVYAVSRKNFYRKKWIRGCGWWPDFAFRLYNKKATAFSDAAVHERILTEGMRAERLKSHLSHYSYEDISGFLSKMQAYSDLFVKENAGKKSSSPCKAVLHAAFAFFKTYILKKGILDGYEGFLISSYNSHTAFYKYLSLYETNSKIRLWPEENDNRHASSLSAQKYPATGNE